MEGVHIRAGELRLIVEHLLEVRDVPEGVHRVAVEAAADVVMHSARGHFPEGEQGHRPRLIAILFRRRTRRAAQEEIDDAWLRKFRRTAEAAVFVVESLGELGESRREA